MTQPYFYALKFAIGPTPTNKPTWRQFGKNKNINQNIFYIDFALQTHILYICIRWKYERMIDCKKYRFLIFMDEQCILHIPKKGS